MIELLIALLVLSLGILAVGQLFPSGSRAQLRDRMLSRASYYAHQELEELSTHSGNDPEMSLGRHPAVGFDTLGQWRRFYNVEAMTSPLDNLRRVTVTVRWTYLGPRQISAVTYLRR